MDINKWNNKKPTADNFLFRNLKNLSIKECDDYWELTIEGVITVFDKSNYVWFTGIRPHEDNFYWTHEKATLAAKRKDK